MFDFRDSERAKSARPTNYLGRREQRRLLMLVMLLGFMLFAMGKAADPRTWQQLGFGSADEAPAADTVAKDPAVPPAPREYDTRIRPSSPDTLPLDTFISRAEEPAQVDTDQSFFPGVDPKLLTLIRDYSPFRAAESPPWFNLLGVLKATDEAKLAAASTGEVGFVQLYEQSNIYRGQLVTVRGVAKRAFEVSATSNSIGIKKLYQLWVFPEGGPISPIVVYCLELPVGFPLSEQKDKGVQNISEQITLCGFSFKIWTYGTGQQIESAPLVLAKTVQWNRPVVAERESLSVYTMAALVAGAALFGIVFAIYAYMASNRLGPGTNPTLARYLQSPDQGPAPSSEEMADTLRELESQASAQAAENGGAASAMSAADTPSTAPFDDGSLAAEMRGETSPPHPSAPLDDETHA